MYLSVWSLNYIARVKLCGIVRKEILKKYLRKEAQRPGYGTVVKSMGPGTRLLEILACLCLGMTLGKYLNSLYISFLIITLGMIIGSLIELLLELN